MKNTLLFGVLFFAVLSCKNATTNTTPKADTTNTASDTAVEVKTGEGTSCFAYLQNRDTILMKLNLVDSVASGNLVYNIYEKDKNRGTFTGLLRGDTLVLNYNFYSEGVRSARQVAFLVKGNILIEGSSSMKEQNGKLVFSNPKDINYNSGIILESVDCDKLKPLGL